jgi:N-acetylglucosaminyldiphosphoundecaprenol N-acetyl-beta-D-mannosaminyltransferase
MTSPSVARGAAPPVPAPGQPGTALARRRRLVVGTLSIDPLTSAEALDAVEALVVRGRGGIVFTPNVDHVVKAERDGAFRAAYREADLCLADGAPLVWLSRLLAAPLPERVAGSDLVLPLARRAAERGWRVYLLGGAPGDAVRAGTVLARLGVTVVGVDAPRISLAPDGDADADAAAHRVRAARPDLLLVALGAPKQEVWIHRHLETLRPAVAVGVGASLGFVAGTLSRAPRWVARLGLEWLYRLSREPRRLWRRYLVEDSAFALIAARTWWRSRSRASAGPEEGAT